MLKYGLLTVTDFLIFELNKEAKAYSQPCQTCKMEIRQHLSVTRLHSSTLVYTRLVTLLCF